MDLNQAGLQRLKSLTINKKPHGLNTGEVFKKPLCKIQLCCNVFDTSLLSC